MELTSKRESGKLPCSLTNESLSPFHAYLPLLLRNVSLGVEDSSHSQPKAQNP